MSNDRKENALALWRSMMEETELYIDYEELYEILIEMANGLMREGVVTEAEWLDLVRQASKILA
ncbi:hypothetical protein ACAW49_03150 [Pseudomonas sp. Env-44]|uniref:Uncharacterized protein n=2 Tax=Pseudomonas fluorescens group TaxID=136843 RepID=A0ABR5M0I1_9PSED|nr:MULTISPECIES: hypothetical protein [Pseudomonas]PRW68822.1 hypothetical protein C7A09_11135 [Pseudomonas fluorescens]AZE67761.1 hypothetical protein C4K01_3568 [Pseudomonas synxantha]KPG69104.1 hypothetical protein AEQ48_25035 [Pseudomonas libanensis]KRP51498.1 hypothetical protein TU77_21170 [Pseudomonas synxantha]MBK3446377.1 hypothetical protein [Pseudomonas lactis]